MQHAVQDIGRLGHHAPVPPVLPFVLRPGEWASSMKMIEYKVIVAEALNATVCDDDYRNTLVGYFITDKSLYLVWRVAEKKIERLFHYFYDQVRDNIRRHFEETKHAKLIDVLQEEHFSREELFGGLFERSVLHDEHLVRLITGRKVELPYSDPYLDRLKAEIHNHPFCSALDYDGAIGPVLVKVMKEKDWNRYNDSDKLV